MYYPLLNLRLAYLRALAKAWSDSKFEATLVSTEHNKNYINVLDPDVQEKNPDIKSIFGALRLGNVSFNIVDFSDDRTTYAPIESPQNWIGSNDRLIVKIPKTPEESQQVEALAAYYQIFPTLFGSSDNTPVFTDAGGTSDPFFQFGSATINIIAMAWKDSVFMGQLTDPDLKDATHLINRYLGYQNPWNFNLQFEYETNFSWDGYLWNNIPNNVIRVHYPEKPTKDGAPYDLAIALTTYNNTGPAYPFSCY